MIGIYIRLILLTKYKEIYNIKEFIILNILSLFYSNDIQIGIINFKTIIELILIY
jgi:hypothetical protein